MTKRKKKPLKVSFGSAFLYDSLDSSSISSRKLFTTRQDNLSDQSQRNPPRTLPFPRHLLANRLNVFYPIPSVNRLSVVYPRSKS